MTQLGSETNAGEGTCGCAGEPRGEGHSRREQSPRTEGLERLEWAVGKGNWLGTCGNQAAASQDLTPRLTSEMRPQQKSLYL